MAEGTIAQVLAGEATWCVVTGDCRDVLSGLPDRSVDCVITDPQYSRRVHENAMTSRRAELPDVSEFSCRTKRRMAISFEYLKPHVRRGAARQFARIATRWSLVFCDVESAWLWRLSLTAAGLNYRRTCEWDREGAAPQFNGMEPAPASEAIVTAHQPGARYWHGGGKHGRYSYPIVQNRLGQRGSRVHETQKPDALMLALVADFSDVGKVVVDGFAGSGTTGVACLRLGRRFIGVELKKKTAEVARERLRAEEVHSDIQSRRRGQLSIYDAIQEAK